MAAAAVLPKGGPQELIASGMASVVTTYVDRDLLGLLATQCDRCGKVSEPPACDADIAFRTLGSTYCVLPCYSASRFGLVASATVGLTEPTQ